MKLSLSQEARTELATYWRVTSDLTSYSVQESAGTLFITAPGLYTEVELSQFSGIETLEGKILAAIADMEAPVYDF